MRKRRIKLLNNKYSIAYHIKMNKGRKVYWQSKIIWFVDDARWIRKVTVEPDMAYQKARIITAFAWKAWQDVGMARELPKEKIIALLTGISCDPLL
jgi:hypothetical protein